EYLNGPQAESFKKLVRNFTGNRKDNQAFRSVVYQIHQFSQSTAAPEQWLREVFLKSYENQGDIEATDLVKTVLAGQDLTDIIIKAENYFKDHYETVT
ncbi:hypothetical protein ACXWOD_09665, partial [Streptococcus pyogenes]